MSSIMFHQLRERAQQCATLSIKLLLPLPQRYIHKSRYTGFYCSLRVWLNDKSIRDTHPGISSDILSVHSGVWMRRIVEFPSTRSKVLRWYSCSQRIEIARITWFARKFCGFGVRVLPRLFSRQHGRWPRGCANGSRCAGESRTRKGDLLVNVFEKHDKLWTGCPDQSPFAEPPLKGFNFMVRPSSEWWMWWIKMPELFARHLEKQVDIRSN